MNDYGLVVHNGLGQLLFDSRKQMKSYVVCDYGTASTINITSDSLVFIQGSTAVASKIVYGEDNGNGTFSFYTYDDSTGTTASVSLSYMCVAPSQSVTIPTGEDYGLLVRSPDGTTQFDSRTITSDAHFKIEGYFNRLELSGDSSDSSEPILISDTAEYIELSRNTFFSSSFDTTIVKGIDFLGATGAAPKFVSYLQVDDPELGVQTTYSPNSTVILIATLDV